RKPLRLPRYEEFPQDTHILSNKNSKTCLLHMILVYYILNLQNVIGPKRTRSGPNPGRCATGPGKLRAPNPGLSINVEDAVMVRFRGLNSRVLPMIATA